jgi:thiosulfate/3-mercaptopyruvate sulfurtransferase
VGNRADSEYLASTDWITTNLDNPDIRIVEVGDLKNLDAYASGHIPGAIHWPWQETLWHPTMREFVTPRDFAELMQKSGIQHDTTIVLYSNSIQFASYAFWVCTMRGHVNMKIFNGKRDRWIDAGRPITREVPQIESVNYPIRATDESCRIGRDGVLSGLDNPERLLLDMRTPEEYKGERVSPKWFEVDHGAVRKGHIPGAKHLFYTKLLNEDESFKPISKLEKRFQELGALPDKELVFYCRLSHRGSMAWFVAKYLLGYPRAKVYDGSWTEWGSIVGMPIVNDALGNQ